LVIQSRIYHQGGFDTCPFFIKVIDDAVYVLHAFKKKSPKGIKTPQQTIDLIHQRLQTAIQIAQTRES
jgi:phage-related protein